MLNKELAEQLQNCGLAAADAKVYADRLTRLAIHHTKLAMLAAEGGYSDELLDTAKASVRDQTHRVVLDANRVAIDQQGGPVIKGAEFEFDPRSATVIIQLVSARSNRMDGGWGIPVSDEQLDATDGKELVDRLTWDVRLKKKLAASGQDPKHLDQIVGKMQAEKIKSLDDQEIHRVFEHVVLSGFCIKYAQAARDCGLTLDDLYPEAVLFKSQSSEAPVFDPYKSEEVVLFKDPSSEVYVAESMSGGNIVITDGWLTDYVNIRGKGDWVRESDQLPITQEIRDFLSSFEGAEEAIAMGMKNQRPEVDDTPSPM